ncbi:Phage (Mu-like) virion morphogenesis protein [Candidatus Phaeomarinobacter ectocarpi]|uniref:Phage (Mu-like) virion morphogenesis protein n=1 Tax=Candidatus Phaeomarinibacter ectocarpi TaxID=1458461 RepID=X5MGX3_9HYPH|nr:PBECR2 nuclease fold domain-containing protein [Candidatus Phaeomarinobacter ectocarpi]CDO60819.1 Phage (Mu-like) virion morphogenesis protein [Candidatus Phaeomarinobacter ectocarpi]
MEQVELSARPPADAVRYFESKGYKVGFDWRDVWQQEHARAFTVAKATRLDILQDIRQEVDKALREGTTLATFKENLTPVLQAKGWWGRQSATDPLTGEVRDVQLGSPRRLDIIYDTNLRTAHAAGRWKRIERNAARRPYLRYVIVDDDRTRDEHYAWRSILLPWDHPFWDTHYPPNGFRCRCIVRQLSVRDMKRLGLEVSSEAEVKAFLEDTKIYRNRRTGQTQRLPKGISPGFAYNVGRAHMRALTPPPKTGPLPTPAVINAPANVDMPAPRPLPPRLEFPEGTSDEEKLSSFLTAFGATRERPVVFVDKIGEPVVISADLFTQADGTLKIGKRNRAFDIARLAFTIMQPDEIWWYWEEHKATGRWLLRRRYLLRGTEEGETRGFVSVFDVGPDGWSGVTAHPLDKMENINRSRRGVLAYRRSQ